MKAVEYDGYGPPSVLKLREVPRPAPRRGELLVRVRAAALNPKDVIVRSGRFRILSGPSFPKRVGFDWAGEVAEVGPGVHGFEPGAPVYGMLGGYHGGACAEYLVTPSGACAPMPVALGFERAASIPLAGSTALQALRDIARVKAGMRVLVNGASGGVGVFAIQLARHLGAEVTAMSSARNLGLCRELGAHVALDYAAADPLAGPGWFDVVLDLFGNRSFEEAARVLPPHGIYVSTVPSRRLFLDIARTFVGWPRARLVVVKPRTADLVALSTLASAGKLVPVVDRVYPLDRIADAQAHVETKHARGKVVVRVA